MSKDSLKVEMNARLDREARELVARGRGVVDPTGKPTIGVDVRDGKEEADPIRKAFALEHPAPGLWCMATLHYKDDKLIHIDRTEPNIKAIAVNELRMANARYWMELG